MPRPNPSDRFEKLFKLDRLRMAIQENRVSFPMPVPKFACQIKAEMQWRLAELYLIHQWPPTRLAERYKISPQRVRQSVRDWVRRATTLGYLQVVSPELEYPSLQEAAQIIRASGSDNGAGNATQALLIVEISSGAETQADPAP